MAWKFDEHGVLVVSDGNPVWIGDDGSESPFDAKANIVAAATAKREAAENRKAKKEAEERLAAFAGIEDPAAALKALQFSQSMDGKKIMDDDGIKRLVESAVKPLQEENTNLKKTAQEQESTIYKMKVSDKFNTSTFLKKTIYDETPDVAEAYFGKHFKVEDGKTVAYDQTGNPIYSSVKAGELADFDEALSVLVNSHPRKDFMLRGTGGGSGAQQNNGGGGKGNNFDHLSPTERITAARAAGQKT